MKVTYRDDHCTIIAFDERENVLRRNGWLGDECEARIFKTPDGYTEIRVFKDNGESYTLSPSSNDPMVKMKANKLLEMR